MSQAEQPWMPGPDDLPWTISLINPHGDRHLGFDDHEGRFCRLWQYLPPEPLTAGEAIMLRPSDTDQIIRVAMIWALEHPGDPRGPALVDEAAAGAKAVILHFAGLAGAS